MNFALTLQAQVPFIGNRLFVSANKLDSLWIIFTTDTIYMKSNKPLNFTHPLFVNHLELGGGGGSGITKAGNGLLVINGDSVILGNAITVDSIKGGYNSWYGGNGLVITGYPDPGGYGGGMLVIKGGTGNANDGGNIEIRGGEVINASSGPGRGGYVRLFGADSYETNQKGGGVEIIAGIGQEDINEPGTDGGGGDVMLTSGDSYFNGNGGDITLNSGNANTGNPGNINFTPGSNNNNIYGSVNFYIGDYSITFTERSIKIDQFTGSLTDGTPTSSEITAIIGDSASTKGAGFQTTIKDSDGSGLLYKIESDGTDWFYIVMTKAL